MITKEKGAAAAIILQDLSWLEPGGGA